MLITHPRIMIRSLATCTELFCCAAALLFPKVFCSLLLSWCHYIFVTDAVYMNIVVGRESPVLGYSLIGIGSIMYGLCMYTYFKVVHVGPGSPVEFEEMRIKDMDRLANKYTENPYQQEVSEEGNQSQHSQDMDEDVNREPEQPPFDFVRMYTVRHKKSAPVAFRYCLKCSCWKPDRCHHCSSCQQCILRMDHHCPWFATCIGFHNQKFFLQFLVYLTVYCSIVFTCTLYILWNFFTDERYSEGEYLSLTLVFLLVISLSFFFAVGVFTLFSSWLILINKTTIEVQEDKWHKRRNQYEFDTANRENSSNINTNIFDLGYRKNLESILGKSYWTWILPITITNRDITDEFNNGINFEVDQEAYDQWCYDAQLQDQLNQQVQDYVRRSRNEVNESV